MQAKLGANANSKTKSESAMEEQLREKDKQIDILQQKVSELEAAVINAQTNKQRIDLIEGSM